MLVKVKTAMLVKVKTTLEIVKIFLANNKIFIDIFSSLAIGIAGVCVSRASLNVSKLQAKLATISVSPHIRIVSQYKINPVSEVANDIIVKIYNDGYPLTDFHCDQKSILVVSRNMGAKSIAVAMPVVYLSIENATDNATGLLDTLSQKNNNLITKKLTTAFIHQSAINGNYYNFDITTILKITYINSLDQRVARYYTVTPPDEGELLSSDKAKAMLAKYNAKTYMLRDIDAITPDMVIKALSH